GAAADLRRRRELPGDVGPAHVDGNGALVPVEDAGSVDGDVAVSLDWRRDDAPALAGVDHEVVVALGRATRHAVRRAGRVAHRVGVFLLGAAVEEVAVMIGIENMADAGEAPLDAAVAARDVVLVVEGGDEHVLRADLIGGLDGADLEPNGARIEVEVLP